MLKPVSYCTCFYIFHDLTTPYILLFYTASDWLVILEFKVPNKASSNLWNVVAMINSQKITKHVTFHTHLKTALHETPTKPHSMQKPKPALRKTPTHSNTRTVPDKVEMASHTTVAAHDIVSLKKAFPQSFDTIRDMPSTWFICTDPNISPSSMPKTKVLIEYCNQIKKALQVVNLTVITLVSRLTEWVSSLTYPWKSDGTPCISFDPWDLKRT